MSNLTNAGKAVPAVIIVGAGLGGLTLAMLFEQINIPYHVFERAAEVRPLGSAMTLGPGILAIFEQLGLYEELRAISLPCPSLNTCDHTLKHVGSVDLSKHEALTGHQNLIFARPDLYRLMQKQVPLSKISMRKKILRTEEKDGKVFIHCSDNTSYEGDILVGADGAYSGVRQSLFKQLDEKGLLPKEDLQDFSVGFINMVGIAKPEDPEKYPQLKGDFSNYSSVLGPNGRAWSLINVPGGQICWGLAIQLSSNAAREQQFRNSEWGPEANEVMLKEFEDLPSPWGGTMGEIMSLTPKDLISKVFIEEKIFRTWYHDRTVLIGDAAHKMTPSAGLGAVNAMQDAVVLANCIFNMPDASSKSIKAAFQEYYIQRHSRCKPQYELSKKMGKIMGGHTLMQRALRYALYNIVPEWVLQREFLKVHAYRPQIAWLPLAENRGTMEMLPQEGKRHVIVNQATTV